MNRSGHIISFHHEWRSVVGSNSRVVCVECGAEAEIGNFKIPRCKQKREFASSGYLPETTMLEKVTDERI